MTQTGTIIGTPHYMSPEQAQGVELTSASDIYSLGIVFYEMLTGLVPYRADSIVAIMYKHVNDPIPELMGQLKIFQPLLNKLLAKKAPDRYQSASEIIKDIERVEIRIAPDLATRIMPPKQFDDSTVNARITGYPPAKIFSLRNPLIKNYAIGLAAFALLSIVTAILYITMSGDEEQLTDKSVQQQRERMAREERRLEMERIRQEILAQEKAARERLEAEKARERLSEQKKKEEQDRLAAQREKEQQARQAALKEKQERKRLAALKRQEQEKENSAARKARLALAMREKQNKEAKIKAEVNNLIAKAETELGEDNLKSAYKAYRQALKLKSRNKKARRGLTKVANRYLDLAEAEAKNKNFNKADVFVDNARTISPSNPRLSRTKEKILALKNEEKSATAVTTPKQRVFGGF
jgi:hypothetical protein